MKKLLSMFVLCAAILCAQLPKTSVGSAGAGSSATGLTAAAVVGKGQIIVGSDGARAMVASALDGLALLTKGVASAATPGTDFVGGQATLTTVNALPKVTASGVLGLSGLSNPSGGVIAPTAADSTTAIQINKNDGTTNVVTVDTTNSRLGVRTNAPLKTLDVAGGSRFTGLASSPLTGTADPAVSTTLPGTNTLFLTELVPGDRITINAETRTVTAIASNTSLTVDSAFTDTAAAAITKLPAIIVGADSTGAVKFSVNELGYVGIGRQAPNGAFGIALSVLGNISTNQTAGTQLINMYQHGAINRFAFYVQTDGSFFGISRYDNAGAYAGESMSVMRSTGRIGFGTTAPATAVAIGSGVLSWEASAGVSDSGISRTSAGLLQINSGTAGKWAGAQAGSLAMQSLATVTGTAVTPTCVPGTCNQTWGYQVVAYLADGTTSTAGAAEVQTALQLATLDASNYNTITWTAVTGATSYSVFRTTHATSPTTHGALTGCKNIATLTCADNGLAGDSATMPTVNSTGAIQGNYKSVDGTYGATVTTCTGFKNGLCISGT
jgi:hypothetical protein